MGGSSAGAMGGTSAPAAGGVPAAGSSGMAGGGAGGGGGTLAGSSGSSSDAGADGSAGAAGASDPLLRLAGAPLVYNPTETGFRLNAVARYGSPQALRVYLRDPESGARREVIGAEFPAEDVGNWTIDGLAPGTRYAYEVTGTTEGAERSLYEGEVTTKRLPGETFVAALITDSHIPPREIPDDELSSTSQEDVLSDVAERIRSEAPDFLINLGDIVDYHQFGFNAPAPDALWSRLAYLTYRRFLRDTLGNSFHFPVIGNWDGESGCNTLEEIEHSRSQRLLYAPGPMPETYAEGGSPFGDYYAFTWGDALFIVLNVMTYTPTCHLLDHLPGEADDWTLGAAQLEWLRTTLENATSKWRFTFIHHTVGGNGGTPEDSAYGRGGGRAAYVGEQAIVHQLLLDHGVQIFFYGHDHVFQHMVVDGVHYALPGSAGAPVTFTEVATGYDEYWTDSGYARLTVGPDAAAVAFFATDGTLLHSFTAD